jgi:hypothetical protein
VNFNLLSVILLTVMDHLIQYKEQRGVQDSGFSPKQGIGVVSVDTASLNVETKIVLVFLKCTLLINYVFANS